ncbi:STAS domain-containing protein [Desulfurispira natronophila]|uniref:Anti-sigma factor antagonist n=1 Tax=Desulfurispira natronophila TaxID=682562 RepID=A0A7W7Y2S0_9BACT|nr:STAS domain-containing protein [Desulfurispira natronophila]MBB5021007.1 anti-sigma B factor antagonist [Desulfurispira natronophila]
MAFKQEMKGDVVLISIEDERLDAHNSNELKEHIQTQLENSVTHIVVDLSQVRFLDSSGLGALVTGFKNARSSDGDLKLTGIAAQVESILKLTRLYRVFPIYNNIDEAIAGFDQKEPGDGE